MISDASRSSLVPGPRHPRILLCEPDQPGRDERGREPRGNQGPRAQEQRGQIRFGRLEPALERRELLVQLLAGREALLGLLGEAPTENLLELARHILARAGERLRLVAQNGRHRVELRLADEGQLRGEHLVEQNTEREDVRARVDRSALDLLGRHIDERPHDLAGAGHVGRVLGGHRRHIGDDRLRRRHAIIDQLAETEVEDLGDALVGQHHVVRLEVPVQHALAVGPRQAGRDAGRDLERPLDAEGLTAYQVAQRLATYVLHDDERRPVLLADVVDSGDVRVIEGGRQHRLLLESLPPLLVPRDLGGEELDRHLPVEPHVGRQIDRPHPALADLLVDAVVTEFLSGCRFHGLDSAGLRPRSVRGEVS
jgi:hypothetical protein